MDIGNHLGAHPDRIDHLSALQHIVNIHYADEDIRQGKGKAIRLYEQGKISSGRAGAMLGMTRSDFLDLLGRYGGSYFDEQANLLEDLHNAQQVLSLAGEW